MTKERNNHELASALAQGEWRASQTKLITMTEERDEAQLGFNHEAEQGMVLVSEKCTKAVCTVLRLGSKADVPSDQLCEIRWAAALVAAMGDADPYAATRMAISAQWLKLGRS